MLAADWASERQVNSAQPKRVSAGQSPASSRSPCETECIILALVQDALWGSANLHRTSTEAKNKYRDGFEDTFSRHGLTDYIEMLKTHCSANKITL
jgi:hypothetical protein